jgi:hypothetical protein
VHRLHELRKAIAESSAIEELPANFSLGYVESNLWSRYSQSDGGVHVDVHTDGPTDSETVVLTGEPVLKELLTGRLSVDQALADGMMIIDGSQTDISAIRHVLQATPAIDRISRR